MVVALAVVAWFVAGRREPPRLDPTTPEGVVQAYVLSLVDGDEEAAVAHLDPKLGCKTPLPGTYLMRPVSLTLVSSMSASKGMREVDLRKPAAGSKAEASPISFLS